MCLMVIDIFRITSERDRQMSEIYPKSISEFLQEQLLIPQYQLNDNDQQTISENGMAEFLYRKITWSKFRRSALDSKTNADIRSKIAQSLANNLPIGLSIPFGAYKNWRLWSYPEPEWSEVFNINYMLHFIAPIASAYQPGVNLYYSYGDNVMDIVSNMPPKDTDRYIVTFKKLLSLFQNSATPPNVKLEMKRINEFYTIEEHKQELAKNFENNVANWNQKYSLEQREKKVRSARRNLMRYGVEDLRELSEEEWEERCLQAAMWCDAHDSLEQRRKFNKYGSNIQIVYVKGPYLGLHLGSCETSTTEFWVGTGVLEVRGPRLLQRIISQTKLTSLLKMEDAKFVNVETPFSNLSQNYNSVCVWRNY